MVDEDRATEILVAQVRDRPTGDDRQRATQGVGIATRRQVDVERPRRGDEKREQLQRIYGTIWPTEDELQGYLKRVEEAKKRDHRELGPRLGLFSLHPDQVGSGLILWHPKGALVRHIIENYLNWLSFNMHYCCCMSCLRNIHYL